MALTYTVLHKYRHNDYELAKDHIRRQLGDISDFELFGKEVLVAVYVRPLRNENSGLTISDNIQKEDAIQGKIVLVLKAGPSAFGAMDDISFREAQYGGAPPKPGDWLMVRAAAGEPISYYGPNAEEVKTENRRGEMEKLYCWDGGWPCRIIDDSNFVGRVTEPHSVV